MGDVKRDTLDLPEMLAMCVADPCDKDFDNSVVQRLIERVQRSDFELVAVETERNEVLEANVDLLSENVKIQKENYTLVSENAALQREIAALRALVEKVSHLSAEAYSPWSDAIRMSREYIAARASAQCEKGNGNGN